MAITNAIASILELAQANLIAHFVRGIELGLALQFGGQILRLKGTFPRGSSPINPIFA